MYYFFLVVILSFHLGCSLKSSDISLQKYGSHSLLNLVKSNNSVQRSARCTPCEQDLNLRKPVSNHLDPKYRGNGADNLGYDWSPMAWGGPAFPKRSKFPMNEMRGRDGRMMMGGRESNQGSTHIICDTCRAYWDGDRIDGGNSGGGGNRGSSQFDSAGNLNYYGRQPGYWQGNQKRLHEDYETRVMSPTVGVLVKPGSRIAYIPSRSGEMYWDGVSGGGTRWDGFSNGISWIGGNTPEWDRSDSEPKNGPDPLRPRNDYFYSSNAYGSWDNQKRPSNWGDNSGRGYYFTNGVPNNIDPQWRDRGYASNWHYGSTNQNGWNGNNMKWNFGEKQWPDNDRAANRFYFNSPQDRTYNTNDGQHPQYGIQYPNYQPASGYPSNLNSRPSWPTGGGYRPNDRFPADFQQGNYVGRDKNRPWDYISRDPFGYRKPGQRPEGTRPNPSNPIPGNQVDNYEKFSSSYGGYDKTSPTDKNDFNKQWDKPSGYGFSKPGYPRYPENSGSSGRLGYPSGHLFVPSDGNRQAGNPNLGFGENRPIYLGNRKPGGYPSSGNQIETFPGDVARPSIEYPGDKRPSIIYTGGRPSIIGSSSGRYPGGGSPSGGYPSGGSPSGGYPSGGSPSGGYPGGGSPSGGYPGGGRPSGGYPGGGSPSGGYPSGGSPSGGYPGGGRPSGGYPGGGSPSGGYPSGGSLSGGYPSGGSPSGGYPGGGRPSGGYPGGGSPSGGYPGGGSPSGGYPGGGSPSGGYPSGGSTSEGYPSMESSVGGYPGGGGLPGTYIDGNKPSGYPEPPSGGSAYPSGMPRPSNYFSGRPGSRPDTFYGGGGPSDGYPGQSNIPYPRPSSYPSGEGSSNPIGSSRPVFYPEGSYSNPGYFGSRPAGFPGAEQPGQEHYSESSKPDGYFSSNKPNYFIKGPPSYSGTGTGGNKNPPKGYYTGFITELNVDDRQSQYSNKYPNYFGSSYPGDKNRDKYYSEGGYSSGYPSGEKNRYPGYGEDRYSSGGNSDGYPIGNSDRGSDKFYYSQVDGNNKYAGRFPSNHRYPDSGGDESNNDKKWNYGQNERKDGIYRRSGGSYPSYKGGQYYTSSYLASMSTTAGSTETGTEPKTQSMTKAEEVTQATSILS